MNRGGAAQEKQRAMRNRDGNTIALVFLSIAS